MVQLFQFLMMEKYFRVLTTIVNFVDWVINYIQMEILSLDYLNKELNMDKVYFIGLITVKFIAVSGWEGFLMVMVLISPRIFIRDLFQTDLNMVLAKRHFIMVTNIQVIAYFNQVNISTVQLTAMDNIIGVMEVFIKEILNTE